MTIHRCADCETGYVPGLDGGTELLCEECTRTNAKDEAQKISIAEVREIDLKGTVKGDVPQEDIDLTSAWALEALDTYTRRTCGGRCLEGLDTGDRAYTIKDLITSLLHLYSRTMHEADPVEDMIDGAFGCFREEQAEAVYYARRNNIPQL